MAESLLLSWQAQEDGFYFQLHTADGHCIAPALWHKYTSQSEVAKTLVLLELYQNGQAFDDDLGLVLPHSELVKLDPLSQQQLTLPEPYPYDILIHSQGGMSDPDFKLICGYYRFLPGGEQLFFKRTGSFLESKAQAWLLNEPQFQLMNILSQNVNETPKGTEVYQKVQLVQSLAAKAKVTLEPYLAEEKIILPEQFELELKWNDDQTLSVLPNIIGVKNFAERFEHSRRIRRMYNLELDDGQSARLVLQSSQQQALESMQALRNLTGEARERFLSNPEQVLDPDLFNLEHFSERVVEWGLYKPRYQPFVSPVKNEWIPGVLIDFGAGEQQQIRIPDQAALDSLSEAIQKSETQQYSHIEWQGQKIPLDTARELHVFAVRQLRSRSSRPVSGPTQVLIIRENINDLEFADFLASPPESGMYLETYAPPPWLSENYSLLPHQQIGLAWMQGLYHGGYSGGLLADDMGLGKTLQTLALLMWALNDVETPSQCLIVAPVSLLENWGQEYRRFFSDSPIPILSAYGDALRDLDPLSLRQMLKARTQIVLTTYETLRKKQLGFCSVDWQVVVLDEAQRIKTPGTLTTNAAKALKAKLKLAATGTPIENSLLDIWCILDFVAPGFLGSASSFRERYRCNDENVDWVETGQLLRQNIGFYLLRRLKRDVLEALPSKFVYRHEVATPPVQESVDLDVLRHLQQFVGTDAYGAKMLETIQQMRSISDHPFLLTPQRLLEPLDVLIASSAKLQATLEILLGIQAANEKVVIFAERRATQHLLYRLLSERFGLNPNIVNGATPAQPQRGALSRQQSIDEFQGLPGFAAIIMSPLAAGVGLNVTAANHVIHYGRHWNPAKEDQATDRVYRLGQSKTVHVYLPMAVSKKFKTFDIVLHELLERKRSLAESSLIPEQHLNLNSVEIVSHLLAQNQAITNVSANLDFEV
jgi:hypothetical protein